MFRTVTLAALIFWLMDIMNMPFMKQFDTEYPVNGWFYIAAFLLYIIVVDTVCEKG